MIAYKSGYKYQLAKDYRVYIGIHPGKPIETKFISLSNDGYLTIRAGYAWDGSSWSIDNKKSMPASLVHDALYQLMRQGLLDLENRNQVDMLYRSMCVDAGMWEWWASIRYKALVKFGGSASDPENKKPIIIAP